MSVEPAKVNFSIWKGATFLKRLTLYTDETRTAVRDLSGSTAYLDIKDKPDGNVLLSLTTGNGGITLSDQGTIDLKITDEDTNLITWKTGVYDLIITDELGDSDAIIYGAFKVRGI